MLRVGLTGGLATGKSFVGQALVELGGHLLKADELGHRVLEPDGAAFAGVVEAFGPDVLDASGRVDRRRLGAIVFADAARLQQLNALVHPAVIAAEESWIEEVGRSGPDAIAIVEAAILIETGSYRRFDRIVLTVCSTEQQIERALKRDGLDRDEVLDRLQRQMPLDEKRQYADYVIDTSGDKQTTLEQVRRLWRQLRSLTQ